jgi:hypothetical protein
MPTDNTLSDAELIAQAKEKMAAYARVDLAYALQRLADVVAGGPVQLGSHAEHRAQIRQAALDLEWATSKPDKGEVTCL